MQDTRLRSSGASKVCLNKGTASGLRKGTASGLRSKAHRILLAINAHSVCIYQLASANNGVHPCLHVNRETSI